MILKMMLVNFLSRKVQSKKHVEDAEDDVEECWFTSCPGKYKVSSIALTNIFIGKHGFNFLFFHYSLFPFLIYIFSSF